MLRTNSKLRPELFHRLAEVMEADAVAHFTCTTLGIGLYWTAYVGQYLKQVENVGGEKGADYRTGTTGLDPNVHSTLNFWPRETRQV